MDNHLNRMEYTECYCLSEREFVHCDRVCTACPSFTGRVFEGLGHIGGTPLDHWGWISDEIKYHKRLAYAAVLDIERVIFNDPATIVFWTDGTKTVVKTHDEPFDPEKGIAMALVKKMQLSKKFRVYVQPPKVKKEPEAKKETCRERLAREHPDLVGPTFVGGCEACPSDFGYRDDDLFGSCSGADHVKCTRCWDQEVKA